jgi:D-alanine-D-alanine ligase
LIADVLMPSPDNLHTNDILKQPKVWVLAPHLHTGDPNVDYYYDFTQSIEEYTKAFTELRIEWVWQPVTMNDYREVIDMIERQTQGCLPVILNLCDGDEINGTPGISVLKLLHEKRMIYTGANEYFYHITTSKIIMKQAFDKAGVATPAWRTITENGQSLHQIFEQLGRPLIVKPAVSGGSMGVGIKSVVHTQPELSKQLKLLFDGYRGWSLTAGGVIAEEYVCGPEYTTFIVGDADKPNKSVIYPPVERVFHTALPDTEKFLSFDRLWETYDEETPLPNDEPFYTYHRPDKALIASITKLSWDAYVAVGGKGYGRIDLRMDKTTGKLYVLEVNAQCGISEDEDYTSIGAILRLSGNTFSQMVAAIIENAFARKKEKKRISKVKKPTARKSKVLMKQR